MARPRRIAPATDAYRELGGRYARYRADHGYAKRTARHDGYRVGEFLAWLEARGVTRIEAVTAELVGAYADHLRTRPKHDDGSGRVTGALSAGAVGRHVAAVRGMLAMLHHGGELASDPASAVEIVVEWAEDAGRGGAVLSQEEVRALYAATATQKERAVLALGYGCGLRIAEAEGLDIGAVRFGSSGGSGCGSVVVERGKGARRRVVPMSAGVRDELADYYYGERAEQEVRTGEQSALILNANGERMRRWTYARVLGQVVGRAVDEGRLSDAARKRVTFHGLRHAVATHLLERGLRLEQVRQFLGHRHVETTEVYTHVSAAMLDELVA